MTEQIPNRNTTWIFVRLHHWTLSLPKVPCGTKCHHMLNIWSINVLACKTTGQQTRLWAKLGEEYTGKGLEGDRTHQPDGDEGPQARGAMPRGCLMPVLQGGHRDWYPGLSQSSKIHMPPPWWSFSTGLKRGGARRQQFPAQNIELSEENPVQSPWAGLGCVLSPLFPPRHKGCEQTLIAPSENGMKTTLVERGDWRYSLQRLLGITKNLCLDKHN